MQVIFPDEQIQLLIDKAVKREVENRLNNTNLENSFLNKQQACEYLAITNNTLDKWIEKGLPVIRIGKTVRFNKLEVDRWLQKQ